MAVKKKHKAAEEIEVDLTPMIDVVFQLLIFFILCTRFKVDERNHRADLPLDEGLNTTPSVPKEQVTIYCDWDDAAKTNSYTVALAARMRKPVPNTRTELTQMVIFGDDGMGAVREKKARYAQVFNALVSGIERHIVDSGAKIEKLEISFAKDATQGARSGTAPWMFVSLAIDAAARVNENRKTNGQPALPVTFKFVDARGVFSR